MPAIESFASCLVSSPVEEDKKEGFKSHVSADIKATENLLVVVLTMLFYVAVILLVAFVGASLWNECLVPAVSVVKEVSTLQLLGIYFLVRFFLM